jgi:hypothetical protein
LLALPVVLVLLCTGAPSVRSLLPVRVWWFSLLAVVLLSVNFASAAPGLVWCGLLVSFVSQDGWCLLPLYVPCLPSS